jgi:hypothetical protein
MPPEGGCPAIGRRVGRAVKPHTVRTHSVSASGVGRARGGGLIGEAQ